ncbi:LOW QUALITY PROTEIN: hypothetical protein M8C21_024147 [Ambrosia artemisiifolia]|uniref:Uncharacterized protein n=1 Tax=Ambrosia artemisiifolia TaxID=4212 RepID=A0AAD5BZE5_AMBAR|nr:LOW QUALITY PROTEIN: hypothetical protein M8C21_024147 [Ambrosia artemisiifolia]
MEKENTITKCLEFCTCIMRAHTQQATFEGMPNLRAAYASASKANKAPHLPMEGSSDEGSSDGQSEGQENVKEVEYYIDLEAEEEPFQPDESDESVEKSTESEKTTRVGVEGYLDLEA